MTLLGTIEAAFGEGADLYEILGAPRGATEKELKRAFRKKSLKYHPDKNPGDSSAAARFQGLCAAHSVLADAETRRLYDDTGEVAEADDGAASGGGGGDADWNEYWRGMFPKVSVKAVREFSAAYRSSDEERAAVLAEYEKARGDVNRMFEVILCSDEAKDVKRFRKMVKAAIKAGEVRDHGWRYEKPVQDESAEAEAALAAIIAAARGGAGGGDGKRGDDENLNPLELAIRGNARRRDDIFAAFEAKYAAMDNAEEGPEPDGERRARRKKGDKKPKGKKGKRKRAPEDIDEAEFQRIQAGLDKKARQRRKRG